RLTRTDRGAHRLLPHAGPVVAHVALHHDLTIFIDLGDAKRTGDDAVSARNAAGFARRLHDAVAAPLYRVARPSLRARRLLGVHADHRHRLHAVSAIDEFEMNHRFAAVRVALGACLDAGLASDAAIWIDEEVEVVGLRHNLLLWFADGGVRRSRFSLS